MTIRKKKKFHALCCVLLPLLEVAQPFLRSLSFRKFNTFWLKETCAGKTSSADYRGSFCSKQRHSRNIVNPLGWGDCCSSFPSASCQFSPDSFPVFTHTASGRSEAL